MSTARNRIQGTAREVLLTAGAILGTLCLLSVVAASMFGVRLLVFESGSMSPQIGTGAVAVSVQTPAQSVQLGDVVSVTDDTGTRITHRVVGLAPAPDHVGEVALTLQGDANAHADAEPYLVATVDRVVWHAEGLGYAVAALSSRNAAIAVGAVVALLLAMAFRGPRPDGRDPETTAGPKRNGGRRGRTVTSSAVALLVGLVAVGGYQSMAGSALVNGTMAGFTDQAAVQAAASAGEIPEPPGSFGCSNGSFLSGYVDVSWPAWPEAPAGYRYLVEATTLDGASTIKTWQVDGTTLPIHRSDFPGSGDYQVRLRGEVAETGWSSASGPVVKVHAGGAGWELNCG